MPTERIDEVAQALWYVGPGRAEIRQETLAPPEAEDVRVRALFGAISRGTEALVLGRTRPGERIWPHARAVHGRRFSVSGQIWLRHGRPGRRRACSAAGTHGLRAASASGPVQCPGERGRRRCRTIVPPQRAVLAANMETALNAVWDAAPGPADRIAVVGAGVVGSLVAYLCGRLPGAEVTLIDIDPARAELARALGVGFATPEARQRRLRSRGSCQRHRRRA